MSWTKILPWIILVLILVILWFVFTRTSGYDSADPRQAVWSTGQAIQTAAVDPSTLTGPWATTPADSTAGLYSFSMDVKLGSAWSQVGGSTYPLFTHNNSPNFFFNNGGGPGATWGGEVTNGVSITQTTNTPPTQSPYNFQVYNGNFAPGASTWTNITVVSDGTNVNYYVNGVLNPNISSKDVRVSTSGIKWTPGTWTWAGLNGSDAAPPIGKMQIRNFYWWANTALTQAQIATLSQANWVPTSTPTAGNILQDPSFESFLPAVQAGMSGAPSTVGQFGPATGSSAWTALVGSPGAGAWACMTNNALWGGAPAQDGQVYISLQGTSYIQQTVTVIPGTVYTISWYERGRPPASANSPGNDINVSINGSSIYNETNIMDTGSWVAKSATWPAPAGITSAILKFYVTSTTDRSTFIDNVSMVATTPAPVAPAASPAGSTPASGGVTSAPITGGVSSTGGMGASIGVGMAPLPGVGQGAIGGSTAGQTLPPNLYVLSYGAIKPPPGI